MKKNIYLFLFTALFWMIPDAQAQTQFGGTLNDSLSAFQIPVGYTRIGNQDYFGFRIQPQLRLGKLGFGINIPVLFKVNKDNEDNTVRNEEYQNGSGSFRLLSYFRYGVRDKHKLYFRFGELDQLRLGQGFLVNNYTNGTSFERRKVGIIFDVKPKEFLGVEGFYSDFNGFSNLFLIRPYVKPFVNAKSAVASSIQFGVSFLKDGDVNRYDSTGARQDTRIVGDGFSALSVDGGVTVSKSDLFQLRLYGQYAILNKSQALQDSINNYLLENPDATGPIANGYSAGSGFSIGADAQITVVPEQFDVRIRLERLFYSEHFLPQFFDAVYEIDKDAKIWRLANAPQIQGTYGSLTATILKKLTITGSLQIPDQVTDASPAFIRLSTSANDFPIKGMTIHGNYIKGNLGNLADAFTLDNNALLMAGFRYHFLKLFMIGADYRWTFARVEVDGIDTFEATKYITPYFGIYIPLGSDKKEK